MPVSGGRRSETFFAMRLSSAHPTESGADSGCENRRTLSGASPDKHFCPGFFPDASLLRHSKVSAYTGRSRGARVVSTHEHLNVLTSQSCSAGNASWRCTASPDCCAQLVVESHNDCWDYISPGARSRQVSRKTLAQSSIRDCALSIFSC